MNIATNQHDIYENIQGPTAHETLPTNEHITEITSPAKLGETNENENLVQPIPALESHIEAVSVQPPSPTIIPLETNTEPARRVRFYNRVRITSGVGHTGRPKSDSPKQEGSQDSLDDGYTGSHRNMIDIPPRRDALRHSADSSTSASYSSSISAPLRSSTELPPKPASARFAGRRRNPLSNVLGSQDANSWLHALAVERRERKNKRMSRAQDETSPLLEANGTATARVSTSDAPQSMQENGHKPDDDWPWKLFTLYYWESQISALCCCETDSEG